MGDKAKGNKKTGKKTAALPFPEKITEFDQYLFGQGTHYEIYKKMGAHFVKDGKIIKTGDYELAQKIENNGFNFEKVVIEASTKGEESE
mgnify:CR=1 FL=1